MWDRTPYDAWLKDGKRGTVPNAEKWAREILRMRAPAPLATDVSAELRRLVEAAEAELV
ncbi:MAG: hypothetical protein NTX16_02765 [Actinobacteria bacterium]|nr:hypothetical protein [Actinomycetota bacterium]